LERADGDTDEAEDFDAEGVEHAADMTVFCFIEGEFEPGVFLAGAEEAGALQRRVSARSVWTRAEASR